MRLPDFIVIGGMRCGSTSLANFIRDTSGFYVPSGKEMHFFDRRYDYGIDWYASHFPVGPDVIAGEATPNYLSHAEAPARIKSVLPAARLVAILRDPVARAYSHYWHRVARQDEDLSFLDALRVENERLNEDDRTYPEHIAYLERSRYGAHLARFFDMFPSSQIRVLILEEIGARPQAHLGDLIRWLAPPVHERPQVDLPPWPTQDNSYVRFRSLRVRSLAKRMPRPLAQLLASANAVREQYPRIPEDAASWLRNMLAQDRRLLEEVLGRRITEWDR